MAANPVDELTRKAKKIIITPAFADIPKKKAPGSRKKEDLPVLANAWLLSLDKNIPVYRYDFRIFEEIMKRKDQAKNVVLNELTTPFRSDTIMIDRIRKCVAVFKTLVERKSQFFGASHNLVYDRAAILYSLKKLQIEKESVGDVTKGLGERFQLDKHKVSGVTFADNCLSIIVTIKPCAEDFQLITGDLSKSVQTNVSKPADHSLQQFLEVLVSQETYFSDGKFITYSNGDAYLLEPHNSGFEERDMPALQEGKYIGVGASKSVRIIETGGGKGGLGAAVVIDVKKTAFHVDNEKLLDKIESIGGVGKLKDHGFCSSTSKMLKGLYVQCSYGKKRSFPFGGLSKEGANVLQIETVDKKRQSIAQYFQNTYKIRLQYPHLPMAIEKKPQGLCHYPLELLTVCENQRVKQSQQTPNQVQNMIRACALPPSLRLMQTQKLAAEMKVDENNCSSNQWFNSCNIKTSQKLSLNARVLPTPIIEYGNNVKIPVNGASWNSDKKPFLLPAKCGKWIIYALLSLREQKFDERSLSIYVETFIAGCLKRGIQIGYPVAQRCIPNARAAHVDECFESAQRDNLSFIHFITSDDLSLHGLIKKLEAEKQILSQDLKSSTAGVAPVKPLTIENIVSKTNLKLGGINLCVRLENGCDAWISNGNRLIIGLDILMATSKSAKQNKFAPSVIGYSANCKKHFADFIGGYKYCEANPQQIGDNALASVVKKILEMFYENRGKPPNHLFILRGGISEGQYNYAINIELTQIKAACQELDKNFRPNITFIAVSKAHNLRLYREKIPQRAKPAQQNIPPGTVIDQGVVNPVLHEFYLNSHSAFQGTAKVPRYTVLFDTSGVSSDELQGVMHALAYNFQIVNSAISCPSPVMIAKRMCERARSNMAAQMDDSQSVCSDESALSEVDVSALNMKLTYEDRKLGTRRFNA